MVFSWLSLGFCSAVLWVHHAFLIAVLRHSGLPWARPDFDTCTWHVTDVSSDVLNTCAKIVITHVPGHVASVFRKEVIDASFLDFQSASFAESTGFGSLSEI